MGPHAWSGSFTTRARRASERAKRFRTRLTGKKEVSRPGLEPGTYSTLQRG